MAGDNSSQLLAVLNRLALVGERLVASIEAGKLSGGGGSGGSGGGGEGEAEKKQKKAESSLGSTMGMASSVLNAGISAASSGLSLANSLSQGRAFEAQISGPVEAGFKELAAFSSKGILLSGKEIDVIADQVSRQQTAAKVNMKRLTPKVNEGVIGNVLNNIGQEWADLNSPKSVNEGTVFTGAEMGGSQGAVLNGLQTPMGSGALSKNTTSFVQADAFGR